LLMAENAEKEDLETINLEAILRQARRVPKKRKDHRTEKAG